MPQLLSLSMHVSLRLSIEHIMLLGSLLTLRYGTGVLCSSDAAKSGAAGHACHSAGAGRRHLTDSCMSAPHGAFSSHFPDVS